MGQIQILCCSFCMLLASGVSFAKKSKLAQPNELEDLLSNGRYEEFERLTRVPVYISKPVYVDEDVRFDLNARQYADNMLQPEQLEHRDGDDELHNNGRLLDKWEKEVPYAILKTNYSAADIATIEGHIQNFNSRFVGVIQFRPQTKRDKDYVAIFNGNGCFTHIGKLGGIQAISLKKDLPNQDCMVEGWTLHEMMHTLGFEHVSSRIDRDEHIKMNPENIPAGIRRVWMDTYPTPNRTDKDKYYFQIVVPYEVKSLMHLSVFLLGYDQPFFNILRDDTADITTVGNPAVLSLTKNDEQMVRNMYGPNQVNDIQPPKKGDKS